MSARKILYFGSDAILRSAITRALTGGRDVSAKFVSTTDRALLSRMLDECAMVLVDTEVPTELANALELCSLLRRLRPSLYVILFAARTTSKEIVAALNAGADDCFEKPADINELAARIRVAFRRTSQPPASPRRADDGSFWSAVDAPESAAVLNPESVELEEADSEPLLAAARQAVGSLGLTDAQRLVRRAMAKEALTRFDGNRHAVARTLRVDRRYVLKLIEEYPEIDPRSASRVPGFPGSEGE